MPAPPQEKATQEWGNGNLPESFLDCLLYDIPIYGFLYLNLILYSFGRFILLYYITWRYRKKATLQPLLSYVGNIYIKIFWSFFFWWQFYSLFRIVLCLLSCEVYCPPQSTYTVCKPRVYTLHTVPSLELGPPLSRKRVCPSPGTRGGTLACGWGVGGIPIPTTGEKA